MSLAVFFFSAETGFDHEQSRPFYFLLLSPSSASAKMDVENLAPTSCFKAIFPLVRFPHARRTEREREREREKKTDCP